MLFSAGETSFTTIELGRFQTPTLIKDGARLKTDLISEVDGVMAFIKKHINKAYVITGAPQREERWDYPLEALREIVINAIVHRDYSSSSDSIVKIFDDRLEVFNPGLLPPNLTVKKLLSGQYVSTVRNRKIADIFKEAGLIEKYGTGVRRILDGFRNHGLPTPIFEEISGGFRVTAYRDVEAAEIAKSEAQSDTQAATQVTTQATAQDTTQAPDNMRRLLDACKEPATLEELMKRTGYRSRKHFRTAILRRAMENGLIEQTHPDKPRSPLQRYRLTEKGKEMADHKAESADNVRHEQLSTAQAATQVTTQATAQDTTQAPDNMRRLLDACKEPATLEELMKRTGYRSRKHFRTAILRRAMENGLIEQTHPDKPRSPLQRYRLTDRGKETVGSISREMVLQP